MGGEGRQRNLTIRHIAEARTGPPRRVRSYPTPSSELSTRHAVAARLELQSPFVRRSVGTLSAQYFVIRARSVSGSFTVLTTYPWSSQLYSVVVGEVSPHEWPTLKICEIWL